MENANKKMNYLKNLKPIFGIIKNKRKIIICLLLFLFIFGIYLYTSPQHPTGYADSEEMMAAAYTLGIPHAPGYPLFNILGKLFTYIPIGTIAFRFSIFSSLFSALSVLLIYLVVYRLTKNAIVSLIGALSLAFSYIFWLWSIIPENFFLLGFFISLLIFLMVSWHQDKDRESKVKKYPYLIIFVFVLALWAQQLVLFMVPALLYFAWKIDKTIFKPCKRWWGMILSGIAGLLPAIYFPLSSMRGPFLDDMGPFSFINFIKLITRHVYKVASPYETAYLPTGGWQLPERIYQIFYYLVFLVDQFTPIVIALAIIGMIFIINKKSTRTVGIFILLCFIFTGPVLGFYAPLLTVYPHQTFLTPVLDKYAAILDISLSSENFISLGALERFYIMSFIAFSVFIGFGVFFILNLLKNFKFNPKSIIIVLILFLLIPVFLFRDNFSIVNKRNFVLGQDFIDNMFRHIEPNAIFITRGDRPTFFAHYYQLVQKKRLDVTLVGFSWNPWNIERLKQKEPDLFNTENRDLLAVLRDIIKTNIDKRPVYINGITSAELVQLGIGENPFVISPRGIALKIDQEWDMGTEDYWEDMAWNSPKNIDAYYDQHAKGLIEQYVIGRSNSYHLHRTRGHYDLAYQDMSAMLELAPDYILTKIASEDWEKNKNTKGVVREFVIGDAEIHYNLGTSYMDKRQVFEAMAEFSAAVYIEPDNIKYRSVLGGAFEMMYWYYEALEQYYEILKLEPEDLELKKGVELRIQKINNEIKKRQECASISEYQKIYQRFIKPFDQYIDCFNLKKPWQLIKS